MIGSIFFDPEITMALYECIIDTISNGPTKSAVVRATGMDYAELDDFLKAKGFAHPGSRISTKAITELKKWYAGKMRRYVRNALAFSLAPDSEEGILFFQFCLKYLKHGHRAVKSWDDIDEMRLLKDFVDACYAEYSCVISTEGKRDNLLERIHRCFLFSLRVKKAPKHWCFPAETTISFILSNRYHIFSGEADSNMDLIAHMANTPYLFQFNQPRSALRPVFCLLGKSLKNYEEKRYYRSDSKE